VFDALAKDAARRRFDMVKARSVDRLGLSLQDLVGFLSDLHAYGIDLFLDLVLLAAILRRLCSALSEGSIRSDLVESVDIARRNSGAHHQPRLRPGPGTPAMHSGAIVP
jgi:DNA invertase Pin-like site-specific DNA recombinase